MSARKRTERASASGLEEERRSKVGSHRISQSGHAAERVESAFSRNGTAGDGRGAGRSGIARPSPESNVVDENLVLSLALIPRAHRERPGAISIKAGAFASQ